MPTEAPSYSTTLATLSVLTAAREHRRIAAALQGGDELYRVLLRTVPDMVVALFDRDMRCQVIDGGIDRIDQWREILEGKTVREALGDGGRRRADGRAAAPRARRRELASSSGSAAAAARCSPCRPSRCATSAPA